MIKVAIVILNWNGRKLLETFLPIVVKNSNVENCEVIIADNHSTDDSVNYINTSFPQLRIIQLDKNYGFAGGYNKALNQVDADYYILLNSDVAPNENWLPPLLNEVSNNPHIAATVPKIKDYKSPEYFEYAGGAGGYIDLYGYTFCRGRIFDKLEKDTNQYNEKCDVFWGSGAALMFKAALYKELGGLDEHFFAHMEEIDLCWRIKNRGYKITYTPDSEVFHLGGGTLNNLSPQKTFLNFRNNLLMMYKNLSPASLFPTLFVRFILDGIAALKFISGGEFSFCIAVLKAHISFYLHLPKYTTIRRQCKKHAINYKHNELYKRSIIIDFFFRNKKRFSDLNI